MAFHLHADAKATVEPYFSTFEGHPTGALQGKVLHKYDETVIGYVPLVRPEELRQYIEGYNFIVNSTGGIDPNNGKPCQPISEVILAIVNDEPVSDAQWSKYISVLTECGIDTLRVPIDGMAAPHILAPTALLSQQNGYYTLTLR